MKAVGSRLERGHDDGSSGAAELSGSHAGLDAKLVNRVSRRKENDGVGEGFVVVNSIEDEIVVLGTQAIDGKGGAASFAVAEGFRVAACARRHGNLPQRRNWRRLPFRQWPAPVDEALGTPRVTLAS